jgi:formylmethanofuran dehydrogenase subunit C
MSKYYSAKVRVEQTFQVNIAAEDEASATRKAKEIDLSKTQAISSRISSVELALEGEVSYEVGTRIKHFLFGIGEIKKLVRTTNADNDFGLDATIEFENGETKHIHLPVTRDKLEILG